MRVGLALGGGAARGLAHILVFEAVEEMGLEVAGVAGTSIGAMMGAAYGARPDAKALRHYACSYFNSPARALAKLLPARRGNIFRHGLMAGNALDAVRLMHAALPPVPERIEGLALPFTAVAMDFYTREAVRLSSGALLPAVAASAAIPGLITPVLHEGRVLVDGGLIDPLPFSCVPGDPDLVIACDVNGMPVGGPPAIPPPMQTVFATGQAVMANLITERLKRARPDILVAPKLDHFRASDFMKAAEMLSNAAPMKDEIKHELGAALESRART